MALESDWAAAFWGMAVHLSLPAQAHPTHRPGGWQKAHSKFFRRSGEHTLLTLGPQP